MVQRLTYRRRLSYNTRSNRVKIVKTPGGKLTYLHIKKRASVPHCGDCGRDLQGIPALRPRQYASISKRQKSVQRAYGGSRCASCVRSRILRAFLIEEHKVVKRVLKSKKVDKKVSETGLPSATIVDTKHAATTSAAKSASQKGGKSALSSSKSATLAKKTTGITAKKTGKKVSTH